MMNGWDARKETVGWKRRELGDGIATSSRLSRARKSLLAVIDLQQKGIGGAVGMLGCAGKLGLLSK